MCCVNPSAFLSNKSPKVKRWLLRMQARVVFTRFSNVKILSFRVVCKRVLEIRQNWLIAISPLMLFNMKAYLASEDFIFCLQSIVGQTTSRGPHPARRPV